jgi:hypothetical protein
MQSKFEEGIPGSKLSGLYIFKNGNMKAVVNIKADLMVETSPDNWEVARTIYTTGHLKMQVKLNSTEDGEKKFVWIPKGLEMPQLKVLKGGEEQENEQMMIQSVVNIQLENLEKTLQELPTYAFSVPSYSRTEPFNFANQPVELQCFGLNIADLDFTSQKGALQLGAYYKEAKY